MSNFWDMGNTNQININKNNVNKNNFNLQEFIKFSKQMKGKDPNVMLQEMVNNGQVTQQQIENAKTQANEILQMIQMLGIKI